jgi:central kinetochore subunit Mis15/CHL4
LNKLSRSSLISLVLDWLDDRNQILSAPYLVDERDDEDAQNLYPAAHSLEELREYYTDLQGRKGGKRDVVDRIIEGDWRDGLSLYQLAMADMQHLYDHPTSQKWTALKVVQLKNGDEGHGETEKGTDLPSLPRFHPPTFLQNLQREVLPDVKAHYNLDRPKSLPMLLLRIYILDSPYNTSLALSSSSLGSVDSSKTIYIAFPDASPHVFVSLTTSTPSLTPSNINTASDTRSLRKLLLDGLPKAFSRPRARYALESTGLAAKSLESLLFKRGQGRTNAAGGGWAVYASDKKDDTPLNNQLPTPPADGEPTERLKALPIGMKRRLDDDENEAVVKRRKLVAQARFGNSAKPNDKKGIERFDVRIEDPFPAIENGGERHGDIAGRQETHDLLGDWGPAVTITLHGAHVFAGVRELVECGIIDGERMPGWMTGEDGVSVGVVKEGRILGFKGSGI